MDPRDASASKKMNYADDVRETARVLYASRSSQIQLLQDAPAAFKELGRQHLKLASRS